MVQENLDGPGDNECIQETWMVQETMNGTGNLDGSGDHEWYRKPGWFRRQLMVQETPNGSGDDERDMETLMG